MMPLSPPMPLAPDHRDAERGWRLWLPNVLLFQLCWFAAILGAAHGLPWLGLAAIVVVVLFHLLRARVPGRELRLIAVLVAIGWGYESLPYALGWIAYTDHAGVFVPFWMVALWANFATVLNVSLRSLRQRPVLLALLGGIGGPLAYWGGQSLGAATWLEPMPLLVYLALGWSVLTPLLARLAIHLDGYDHGR